MIIAQNIHKSYRNIEVLKGVNIEVQKAEVVSIVGASGAGKSTLLHILGTLDKADEGSLSINGENINGINARALAKFRNQNIGFVFQFHHLLPEFSALENVCIPAFIANTSKKEAFTKGKDLLGFLGLGDRLTHKPSELSGGELQRVAVARALINVPSVILADEPSGNLDSGNARDLHQLFFSLRDQFNQTFLIATHNEELANMADRKLLIKDGVLIDP
ncbi:ABC transporter ATP-binding protein [Candidatus Amoebophilus asiaticus]|nr:ABC transporter ATP-binding protein [Candidatus Amoebophilus asiaticus]